MEFNETFWIFRAERLIYIYVEAYQLYPTYTSWNIEETKWKNVISLRLDRSKYRGAGYKAYQLDVWLLIGKQGRQVFDFVLMSFQNVYSNVLTDFLPYHFYLQDWVKRGS